MTKGWLTFFNTRTGNCGSRPNTRIVGGHEAVKNSWPWQVQLRTTSGFPFCGGSLVDPSWVVTATHCVTDSTPSSVKIRYFIIKKLIFPFHPFYTDNLNRLTLCFGCLFRSYDPKMCLTVFYKNIASLELKTKGYLYQKFPLALLEVNYLYAAF